MKKLRSDDSVRSARQNRAIWFKGNAIMGCKSFQRVIKTFFECPSSWFEVPAAPTRALRGEHTISRLQVFIKLIAFM